MNVNSSNVLELTEEIKREKIIFDRIRQELSKSIVGQASMIDSLLIGLMCDGHILLEGVPGLAKTLTVSSIAKTVEASFKRLQFTPDLLPADIIGTEIYDMATSSFMPKQGPIFANIILADEINRSPAKVQSALLEAMQEHQVTIGSTTYQLPDVFLVLATQNPIEQEGTYPLPEAQVDRFMLKILVQYPTQEEELEIIKRNIYTGNKRAINTVCSLDNIKQIRRYMADVYIEDKLIEYIVNIVDATRNMKKYNLPEGFIEHGASPRAGICITKAAQANAILNGRGFVMPEDIRAILHQALRHRISLSYEAEAENINSDAIITKIINQIEVP